MVDMTHSQIIDALGGTDAVSEGTGSKKSAVSNWRKRGIPWRHKIKVARLAKERNVLLPADFLVQM